ncbi:MAG: fasciclin domain-containing protein [Calditrichia bacterium]
MKYFNLLIVLIIAGFALLFYGCESQQSGSVSKAKKSAEIETHGQSGVVDEESKKNILQIAMGSADHTTLVAAVKAAGLEDVLVNPGPLTVFAPTNAAFEKLPPGTVDDLLKPENKSKLRRIITSHAAPGTFYIKDLKDGMQLYMATGHYVPVGVKNGDTYVNGTKILASVDASNGVVHIIDDVFLLD